MTEVVEAYRGYSPPCDLQATVEELLGVVPAEYLVGLQRVVLTNTAALAGTRKRRWSWHRGRKVRHTDAAGLYHHATRSEPAAIEVFVDQALADAPAWALRLRFVRTTLIGEVLFHEVGHHIHARHRPEYRDREDVADEWGRKLSRRHFRRRHKLLAFMLAPIALLRGVFRSSKARSSWSDGP